MSTGTIAHWLWLALPFCLLILVIRHFLIRSKVLRAMSENRVDEQSLAAINKALVTVNAQCRAWTFTAERAATFLFREKSLWLILGDVGSIGPGRFGPTWFTRKCLYALADVQQSEWMRKNNHVFSSVYLGDPYSVFWVKFSRLNNSRGFKSATPIDRSNAPSS
jgi:hypothetical protein